MRVAFMGTPKFAATVLENLLASKHKVVCAVTQPDAEAGRGRKVSDCPAKQVASAHGIPVFQPKRINKDVERLMSYKPDIIVTAAFGQILRQAVLDAAPHGVINVHGSLLPKYRGAAPIQWAVINGETETGVTIAKTELGLDCGDIIEQVKTKIGAAETSGDLFERLSAIGGDALVAALDKIEAGKAKFTPQDESKVTFAPMMDKETGHIDWQKSAKVVVDLVRGTNPWPVAYFLLGEEVVRVHEASVYSGCYVHDNHNMLCGQVISAGKYGLLVKCGSGTVSIDRLQPVGKKIMTSREFLNGRKIPAGAILC